MRKPSRVFLGAVVVALVAVAVLAQTEPEAALRVLPVSECSATLLAESGPRVVVGSSGPFIVANVAVPTASPCNGVEVGAEQEGKTVAFRLTELGYGGECVPAPGCRSFSLSYGPLRGGTYAVSVGKGGAALDQRAVAVPS